MNHIPEINALAAIIIMVWALWCGASPKVKTGIVGCVIYAAIALAAYAVLMGEPGVVLNVAIAALGARHMFMKLVLPHVMAHLAAWFIHHSVDHKPEH